MTIARDRLRLRDFTPLEQELEITQQLDELVGRFALDASGHIVKLYIGRQFTDQHIQLARGLPRLQFFTTLIHPHSASGISAALRIRDEIPDCWIDILDHPSERKPVG